MSIEGDLFKVFEKTIEELDLFLEHGPKDREVLLFFTGGEPLYCLETMEKFNSLAKELQKKHPNRLYRCICTNGEFAKDPAKVQRVKSMQFDYLQFSCSKDHLTRVSVPQLIAMAEEMEQVSHVCPVFLGQARRQGYQQIFDLYKDKFIVYGKMRATEDYTPPVTERPEADSNELILPFCYSGFYILPDGAISVSCTQEGQKDACVRGSVYTRGRLSALLTPPRSKGALCKYTNVPVELRTFNCCGQIRKHIPHFCCHNETAVEITCDEDGLIIKEVERWD
jgi:hypothetical protein